MKVRFLNDVNISDIVTITKGAVFEAVEDGNFIMIRMKDDSTVKAPKVEMSGIFEILTKEEEVIYEISKKTGFDEITIGCFLSNYRAKHVCPPFNNGWCKDYEKCRVLERVVGDMIHKEKKPTNGDRIRSMTDEELAGMLISYSDGYNKGWHSTISTRSYASKEDAVKNTIKFLQNESED